MQRAGGGVGGVGGGQEHYAGRELQTKVWIVARTLLLNLFSFPLQLQTERGFLPTLRRPCQFGLAESREREGDNSACQQQPNCQHNVHTHGVDLTVSCKIVIVGKMQQRGSERARFFFCLRDLPLTLW